MPVSNVSRYEFVTEERRCDFGLQRRQREVR